MDSILIGIAEESIAHEVGTSVSDQAITFHLSHSKTTIATATFERLSSQHSHRTTGSTVHLIIDQMLQSLIKSRPHEDASVQKAASVALVDGFVTMLLVSHRMQTSRDIFDRNTAAISEL